MGPHLKLLVFCFLIGYAPSCPDKYEPCGSGYEGTTCSQSGVVAYGLDYSWSYLNNPGSIVCDDETFGNPEPANINQMECCG